jgi:adenosine kinase
MATGRHHSLIDQLPTYKRVVVTGTVAYDMIMVMDGTFGDHIMPDKVHMLNVSFVVDSLDEHFGGVGGNQAYGLSLFGLSPLLFASCGNDFGNYRLHLEAAGVDLTGLQMYKNLRTPRGMVITDRNDNQVWVFYAGAMRKDRDRSLGQFLNTDTLALIVPTDPLAMERYVSECQELGVDYLYDPAFYIPNFSKKALVKALSKARIVIGNDYEITLLKRKSGISESGLFRDRVVVVTKGAQGSSLFVNGNEQKIQAATATKVVDPTGAGDAFRAGLVGGILKGQSWITAAQMGALTATYAIERSGTQAYHFSLKEFEKRYEQNYGTQLQIN